MSIKVVVIDDEKLSRHRIVNLLNEFNGLDLIDECSTGKNAIQTINTQKPELVFLDIQLKDMNAFDVINNIESGINPTIILITAYEEFALKAYEFYVFDYLLKPFKDERFIKSTKKVIEYIKRKKSKDLEQNIKTLINDYKSNSNTLNFSKEKIPVKIGNKVQFINSSDVRYIIASGYYSEIYTESKKHLLRISLSSLIIDLNSNNFMRIHRSYIINVNFIEELISSGYGEYDVKMYDNKLLRISKSYKKQFLKKIGLKL